MEDMIDAISKELHLRKDYLKEEIETIYFGGGTPSLLSTDQISFLLNEIRNTYSIEPQAEITLEANPEDIDKRKARELFDLGVNRISLGVQSFDDLILQKLNRAHSKEDAIKAIQILQNTGFRNLTIDLIYGIPDQSYDIWVENIVKATTLEIPHLSCYALTIEDKTAFGHWQKTGKLKPVSESRYEEDYKTMCSHLAAEGYNHYEVSNFAKPGFESRHNSSYWRQELYMGLGPGAHSYNGKSRQFNVSNNATYVKALVDDEIPNEIEILSDGQIYNEYILTSLRTSGGLDLLRMKAEFGINIIEKHKSFLDRCLVEQLAVIEDNHLILTDKALILADSIIIELMIEKE